MQKNLFLVHWTLLFALLLACVTTSCHNTHKRDEQHIYIISTNDIHANINAMPQLATLVDEYRSLGEVVVIDSGDRITGNAFVDDAPTAGVPMIELMNSIGYDVVTLGNHEFDYGSETLGAMIQRADFDFVCANLTSMPESFDICPTTIIEVGGIAIGFAGVVDTDGGGRPLGNDAAYSDYSFSADLTTAAETGAELATECDFAILLSHMGLRSDRELAAMNVGYDWIAGGHSHDIVGEQVGDVYISQNRKNLDYVTIADIVVRDGEIESVNYHREAIDNEAADAELTALVARIKSLNPELSIVEGRATAMATQDGVANFTVDALATYPYNEGFTAEVTFYHYGGVRLSNILPGDITRGDIYNNDPFHSTIYIGELTAEQMEQFILEKYNSGTPESPDKESHYLYFRSDNPYTLYRSGMDADSVRMHGLERDRTYRVAMCNYIAENYIDSAIVAQQLHDSGVSVRDAMLRHIRSLANEGFTPNNQIVQTEVVTTTNTAL